MSLARRLACAGLAMFATAALVPATASAADACRGEGVRFTARGDGEVMRLDSISGEELGPVEGRVLSYSGRYRADGVTVSFSQKRVRYTVHPGALFKPGCASTSDAGRSSFPAPYLTRGRIDVTASRRSSRWHGVNTFEGVFYGPRERRTARYTVRRSYRGDAEFRARTSMKVVRGRSMRLTPYSDIARPHSCRQGRSISITTSGRIRGG